MPEKLYNVAPQDLYEFWRGLPLEKRSKLASFDKSATLCQLKQQLKRRCTCPTCKFNKISYFEPQAKWIDAFVATLVDCNKNLVFKHNECAEEDKRIETTDKDKSIESAYEDEGGDCEKATSVLSSHITLLKDTLFIKEDALVDDLMERIHNQKKQNLLPTGKRANHEKCNSEKPKLCEKCVGRLTFETHIASLIEEAVNHACYKKLVHKKTEEICRLLIREEEEAKLKQQVATQSAPPYVRKAQKSKNLVVKTNDNSVARAKLKPRVRSVHGGVDASSYITGGDTVEDCCTLASWTTVTKDKKKEPKHIDIPAPIPLNPSGELKVATSKHVVKQNTTIIPVPASTAPWAKLLPTFSDHESCGPIAPQTGNMQSSLDAAVTTIVSLIRTASQPQERDAIIAAISTLQQTASSQWPSAVNGCDSSADKESCCVWECCDERSCYSKLFFSPISI